MTAERRKSSRSCKLNVARLLRSPQRPRAHAGAIRTSTIAPTASRVGGLRPPVLAPKQRQIARSSKVSIFWP